ncbi:MAG: hypothetical protein LUI60_07995 [Clostridia bacterium]|nr:hypothetical protein [Clostridia bacterium]
MNDLVMEFDLEDDRYFTALRLVAGAMCNIAEKDVDTAEDFKVCVSESALILKNNGFSRIKAQFNAQNGVKACLSGEGASRSSCGDNELSLALIGALVESCSFEEKDGVISSVALNI